jgi:hypothetical protein
MQATAALAAFNLICHVQAFGDHVPPLLSERVITFRVDPLLGRWCLGVCPAAQPLAAMSGAEIVFDHAFPDGHRPGHAVRVQRLTGAYVETIFGIGETALSGRRILVGQCERAPFGGFPPESMRFATPLRVQVPARIDRE